MTRSERLQSARIAVDLSGGGSTPAAVVDGALHFCDADPDLHRHLIDPPSAAEQVPAVLPARPDFPADDVLAELTAGRADVVVADGFTGNVLIMGLAARLHRARASTETLEVSR